jgi:signal transduction histidine kinase
MANKFLLTAFTFIFFIEAHSQNMGQILRKAYSSGDSAHYYFQEAQKMIKTKADEAEFIFFKSVRATNFGPTDSAVFFGLIAEEKFKILNDSTKLIFVYNNLAKSYQKQGLYEKAISVLFEGLKLAEVRKDDAWMGYLYQNISLNYHDFENYENGVKYGKLAFTKLSNLTKPDVFNAVLALNAVAINFDDWNKPDSALFYHFKVFDYKDQLDTLSIGFTYNNIGNTLLKQKKYAQAKNWIERAIAIARANFRGINDIPFYYENATNYTNLAAVCYELGEFRQAEAAFYSAHIYVIKSNSIEKLRDYNYHQYQFSKKRGNLSQALHFQEEYFKIKDRIFDEARAKTLAELETKYQTEKKEKELAESRSKILEIENKEKQKTYWLLLTALLTLFALIFSFLIFRQQKLKLAQQKQQFQLKEEISRIETQNKLHEQRLSISRDLHDNIGSQLTFIISSVNNLKFRHKTENQPLLNQLNKIGDFASDTMAELRDTIWAINSNHIKFDDLRARIFNFLEKARNTNPHLNISFNIEESLKETELTATAGVNIYRTIQEAVNNALKYAGAKTIAISIKIIEIQFVEITITDDGKGFDPLQVEHGNGLHNMAKRMEDIEGKLNIESQISKGTKITLLLNINKITAKKRNV